MPAAWVNGNQRRAVAVFLEDSEGDLVDINYLCPDCCHQHSVKALPWPGYMFPDYSVYCQACNILINLGKE